MRMLGAVRLSREPLPADRPSIAPLNTSDSSNVGAFRLTVNWPPLPAVILRPLVTEPPPPTRMRLPSDTVTSCNSPAGEPVAGPIVTVPPSRVSGSAATTPVSRTDCASLIQLPATSSTAFAPSTTLRRVACAEVCAFPSSEREPPGADRLPSMVVLAAENRIEPPGGAARDTPAGTSIAPLTNSCRLESPVRTYSPKLPIDALPNRLSGRSSVWMRAAGSASAKATAVATGSRSNRAPCTR